MAIKDNAADALAEAERDYLAAGAALVEARAAFAAAKEPTP